MPTDSKDSLTYKDLDAFMLYIKFRNHMIAMDNDKTQEKQRQALESWHRSESEPMPPLFATRYSMTPDIPTLIAWIKEGKPSE